MRPSFYRQLFAQHPDLEENQGLFYQKLLQKNSPFEQQYTLLRKQEGRLYTDELVRKLPDIPGKEKLNGEWKIRKNSTNRLIRFLKKNPEQRILEIGCGNGWLLNAVQEGLNATCCGIDVNETELRQAVKVFGSNDQLTFLCGNITSDLFDQPIADIVIIASAIQYFPDPAALIQKLSKLLFPGGSIHILDSPFYDKHHVATAQERSKKYFLESGMPAMADHYFHHSWQSLIPFQYKLEHNPASLRSKLRRPLDNNSPFPWIIINDK
jgi:ubiquinone/menaquinone biosynthesis C-methylase UbiE